MMIRFCDHLNIRQALENLIFNFWYPSKIFNRILTFYLICKYHMCVCMTTLKHLIWCIGHYFQGCAKVVSQVWASEQPECSPNIHTIFNFIPRKVGLGHTEIHRSIRLDSPNIWATFGHIRLNSSLNLLNIAPNIETIFKHILGYQFSCDTPVIDQ